MKYKGFISDMDGVTTDTEESWFNGTLNFLKPCGIKLSKEEYEKFIGQPEIEDAKFFKEEYNIPLTAEAPTQEEQYFKIEAETATLVAEDFFMRFVTTNKDENYIFEGNSVSYDAGTLTLVFDAKTSFNTANKSYTPSTAYFGITTSANMNGIARMYIRNVSSGQNWQEVTSSLNSISEKSVGGKTYSNVYYKTLGILPDDLNYQMRIEIDATKEQIKDYIRGDSRFVIYFGESTTVIRMETESSALYAVYDDNAQNTTYNCGDSDYSDNCTTDWASDPNRHTWSKTTWKTPSGYAMDEGKVNTYTAGPLQYTNSSIANGQYTANLTALANDHANYNCTYYILSASNCSTTVHERSDYKTITIPGNATGGWTNAPFNFGITVYNGNFSLCFYSPSMEGGNDEHCAIDYFTLYFHAGLDADEAEGRGAIQQGVETSVLSSLSYTNYTDKQIYLYNSTYEALGKFDVFVIYSNQRWAFNYIYGSDNATNMSSLGTTVNILELTANSSENIRTQVSEFINETKQ